MQIDAKGMRVVGKRPGFRRRKVVTRVFGDGLSYSRLSLKLVLFVGTALLAYTAAFLFFVLRDERHKAQSAVEGEALRLSETIRKSVEFELLKGRRDSVQSIVAALSHQQGIEEVNIYNKQGRIVVTNKPENMGVTLDPESDECMSCHSMHPPATFVSSELQTNKIVEMDDGRRVLHKVEPLYNLPRCYVAPCHVHPQETRVLGMMDVIVSMAETDRVIVAGRNRTVLFATLLFVIVSATIALFIRHYVHVPISKLVKGTQAVAAGDLDRKVLVASKDDVGLLAESFNKMTDDLKQAREDYLRNVDKMASIGQVAAGIAHSLNTPLTTINNGLHGLRKRQAEVRDSNPALADEVGNYLGVMDEEVRHCRKVIRDLLDCARKPEPRHEPTDLKLLVASTVNSVLLNHDARVTTRLHQTMEPRLMVMCNGSYLKQAFLNILQNGYDAIEGHGVITVTTRRVDGGAEVIIEDTGCGIPERDEKRVFEPLYTTKGPGKGTGLGLAVARDIMEEHQGDIRLDRMEGRGTKVTVTIPLMEAKHV
jgi:two-component system NtrC family sensor kinase